VGIDSSLTNTGLVRLGDGVQVRSIPTTKSGDSIADRLKRLDKVVSEVRGFSSGADLAVIEGPAYSSKSGAAHERSGLWWMIVSTLFDDGIRIVEIPPTSRSKYATGKGNAGKDEVLLAVSRKYAEAELITNNDEADALVLAAMGMRLLGSPIETSIPANCLEAFKKVRFDDN